MNKEDYVVSCWNLCERFVFEESSSYGKYIQLQVKKFREWTTDPRYEFRLKEVEKVYRFFSYLRIQLKNNYVQFPMLSWQAFYIALIFGFYRRDNGRRKHTEALLFIARKNGKTAFAASLILYGFLKDGVTDPQSILVAMNQKQAANALRYAKSIIYHSPALLKRLAPLRYKIISRERSNQGFIEIMSSIEPERLEGFSPSFTIIDELHGFESSKIEDVYSAIKNGTGARENPLTLLATTAGTKDNIFVVELLQYYKDVLDGTIEDESVAGVIFQPDPTDSLTSETAWRKANPSIGTVTTMDSIREAYQKVVNSASTRAFYQFVTRRVNVFLEEPTDWIDPVKLDKCFKPLNINDFKDQECFLGVDLSITSDLSALAQVFHKDGTYYVFCYFYMANNPSKLMRKGNFDLNPYINIYIHRSEKGVIDYQALIKKVNQIDEDFRVVKLLYDRYNAPFVISEIQETSKVYCEDFAQRPVKFNAPLKYMQDLVETGKLIFDENPVLRWNFTNVVIRAMDTNENIKIDKKKKKDAVDGVVATAQAIGGWMQYLNPIYENI